MPYRPKDIYRGRRKFRVPLVILLFVVAALLIGGISMFYILQQYLVYDQDGVTLQLPSMASEADSAPAEETVRVSQAFEPVEVEVIYEAPDFSDTDLGGWDDLTATRARFIAYDDAASESRLNAVLNGLSDSYNGVVLELKSRAGTLAWASTSDMARGYGAAGEMDYTEIVASLHERGLTAAAQISCLADRLLGQRNWTVTLQDAGGVYQDSDGMYWLDPYNLSVRTYIADLMAELAAMGFDEIILADLCHPAVDTAFTYTVTLQTEASPVNAVCQMARRLAETLQGTDTAVSVLIRSSSLYGDSERTGQDMEIFWRIFARVYCPSDYWNAESDRAAAAETMYDGDIGIRFAPVCVDYTPEGFDSYVMK